MPPPVARESLRDAILRHVTYNFAAPIADLTPRELLSAVALAVRDCAVEAMLATDRRFDAARAKRLCYLSMEFLVGRSLTNNLLNLDLLTACRDALRDLGLDLDALEDNEPDAALGNGGLGRLAACYLDSLATLDMPGNGYGINYEYGLFRQEIRNGEQVERPDNWRTYASPWLLERPQDAVLVPLYGHVDHARDRAGNYNPMWLDWKVIVGVPHDLPIVGHGGRTVNRLRLFSARASHDLDMGIFNEGDYLRAVEQKVYTETISKVLYPSDAVAAGQELRLAQEYFLVACAVRDVVRQYRRSHDSFDAFPDQVAIQLNDTHPSLAVAELMRLLIDEGDLAWEKAWEITTATLAYTNHTLMPEALERWPVPLLERMLPRHMQIIYEINRRFLEQVTGRWPGDDGRLRRTSLIEEGPVKQVRMAHLAIVGSHAVNGVAQVHSELVRTSLVPDFAALWPEKFTNVTNGVTQRRWLQLANPGLDRLITGTIGPGWRTDLEKLRELEEVAGQSAFQEQFAQVKRRNKERLAVLIKETTAEVVGPDTLFDMQVKRIHEYKRQLLHILHVVHLYLRIVEDGHLPPQPRTHVFAGKAAPGYRAAKQIIRLINDVARVVNRDPKARSHLRVVFVPDYRVSLAEVLIPAADLSEQISTAGTEASGTSNMKFAMNGALTVGTLDGANIEICEEVGRENVFIFGLTVPQVRALRAAGPHRPAEIYARSPVVHRVLDTVRSSRFCRDAPGRHEWVALRLLTDNEPYLHLADLESYLIAHSEAASLYADRAAWANKAILNVARIGKFSSDRAVRDYAREIWRMRPVSP